MENKQTTETDEKPEKQKSKTKAIVITAISLLLLVGIGVGIHHYTQSATQIVTDNARITANLVTIMPTAPGRLERFTINEGNYVKADEILGWVENGESFRSPIDGLVVRTNAVQGQMLSPMEPLAVPAI